jgi:hypothetical protein
LRASEWYRFFESVPGDGRSQLTWRRRLSNFRSAQVYNFYSTGDELFRSPPAEVPAIPEITAEQLGTILGSSVRQLLGGPGGVPLGLYSWSYQEKLKGRTAFNGFLGSNHGGWGFNLNLPASNASSEVLKVNPYFNNSYDTELFGANGSQHASQHRDRILSDAIPSSTLAVGGNAVPRLLDRNLDLNAPIVRSGWPSNRQSDQQNWHHSDIREVAYRFISKAFEAIVTEGTLQ